MDKTKLKNTDSRKRIKNKADIKKSILKKIDSLSWEMGKKTNLSRNEFYDR